MSSGTLSVTHTCLVQSDPCYSTNRVHLLVKDCRKEIIFLGKKLYFHVSANLCQKDTDVIQPCVVGWGLE